MNCHDPRFDGSLYSQPAKEAPMATEARIKELDARHTQLDARIIPSY